MSLLAPTALVLGLLALPIIALYMLRLRRQEQLISSTLLWLELVRDQAANAPWQKLRRNLLLLLQLLILAALVLALARPTLRVPGFGGGNVIVLLDASASMQATDGQDGTRFDDARAEVERIIRGLSGGDRLTLIRAGQTPGVLAAATDDRGALRRALQTAAPDNGPADWSAAFALAAGSAQGLGDPRIVIVSDGRLPDGLPALPGEVGFAAVGRSGDNLALKALAARPTAGGADLLVSAQNTGPAGRSALLNLYVNGSLVDSRRVDLEPGEELAQTWSLPANAGTVEARLEPREGTADYLALDDRAWAVLDRGETRRVLLVSEGNLFLERLFAVLPGYEVTRVAPEDAPGVAAATPGEFDLYVYDSVTVPAQLPGNSLIFNPQPDQPAADSATPLLTVGGVFSDTTAVRVADSTLLAGTEWGAITIAEGREVEAPALESLVDATGGPLLLVGESAGQRVAVFTFDLRATDLPLQIAFPVIMANITAWLSPGRVVAAEETVLPGAIVTLVPDARATAVSVTRPDGAVWEQETQTSGEPLLFSDTQQTGLYRVAFVDGSGESRPAGAFAVNFFFPDESSIAPVETLRIGQVDVMGGNAELQGLRELWPWLLGAGLGVLLLEWWLTYRRGTGRPIFKLR